MIRIISFFFLFGWTLTLSLCCQETPLAHSSNVEQVFAGQVISVQKFSFVNRPVPYVQFIMQSQGVSYTVEVGPDWYVTSEGFFILPSEEIEVSGYLVSRGKQKIIIAAEIRKRGASLRLRSPDGSPIWGSQRNTLH